MADAFLISLKEEISEDKRQPKFDHLIKCNLEVNQIPSSFSLLKAFTLASTSEDFNMERSEVLGDVYLKYSIGLRVFCVSLNSTSVEKLQLLIIYMQQQCQ